MGLIDVLLRPLRSSVVTRAYPPNADVPDRDHRGTPQLQPERCCRSGDCVNACPTAAITLQNLGEGTELWKLDYGLCVFCGLCVDACPEEAIITTSEFELAARHRDDVIAVHAVRKVTP